MRREAQKKGWPLEEIHRRLLHLNRSIELAEGAYKEFLKALGDDLADDDSDEDDNDADDFESN